MAAAPKCSGCILLQKPCGVLLSPSTLSAQILHLGQAQESWGQGRKGTRHAPLDLDLLAPNREHGGVSTQHCPTASCRATRASCPCPSDILVRQADNCSTLKGSTSPPFLFENGAALKKKKIIIPNQATQGHAEGFSAASPLPH